MALTSRSFFVLERNQNNSIKTIEWLVPLGIGQNDERELINGGFEWKIPNITVQNQ